jgi:hypothetical protein
MKQGSTLYELHSELSINSWNTLPYEEHIKLAAEFKIHLQVTRLTAKSSVLPNLCTKFGS